MNFYSELEKALFTSDVNTKELIINKAIDYCRQNEIKSGTFKPKIQSEPSFYNICQIVTPKDLPKRTNFSSNDGLIALLHSIAHIEFSAIDLAIDAVYRFVDMPNEYKLDWLIVAQDEVRHYKMLSLILTKLNAKYGDLPVHQALFDMADKTKDSVIERMAVIPRYFEASGLDVNPKISAKLIPFRKNPIVQEIIYSLNVIYNEEIEHVTKGDKWFKYLCEKEGSDYMSRYIEIIGKYHLKGRVNQYNVEARIEAGFTCDELKGLGVESC